MISQIGLGDLRKILLLVSVGAFIAYLTVVDLEEKAAKEKEEVTDEA